METRLRQFMDGNGISCVRLAVRAGITAQHLTRLREGTCDPVRPTMVTLAGAARAILRRPVRVTELFDLGDGER